MKKLALILLAGLSMTGAAQSEQLVLEADKTIMVTMADRPSTVVVGNPSIADISINANTLFLHGRGFGNTNVIVLGSKGEQLANFDLTVKMSQTDPVTVLSQRDVKVDGIYKVSYSCSPVCERQFQVMDTDFKDVADSMKAKNELATGSKTAEAEAPSAAQ
jgi:hypothetical protein